MLCHTSQSKKHYMLFSGCPSYCSMLLWWWVSPQSIQLYNAVIWEKPFCMTGTGLSVPWMEVGSLTDIDSLPVMGKKQRFTKYNTDMHCIQAKSDVWSVIQINLFTIIAIGYNIQNFTGQHHATPSTFHKTSLSFCFLLVVFAPSMYWKSLQAFIQSFIHLSIYN